MKEKLENLFLENKDRYKELIEKVKKENTKEVWTIGLGNPFEIIPYENELLGIKSGKVMKQNGKPSKSRYCNNFNIENKIIYSRYYKSFNETNKVWFINDYIYIYNSNYIIRLSYEGLENNNSLVLKRLVFVKIVDKNLIKSYRLDSDGEFTEDEYIYEGDKIIEINTNWLSGSLMGYSRKFKIYYENDNVRITSISKNGEKQIYPEK